MHRLTFQLVLDVRQDLLRVGAGEHDDRLGRQLFATKAVEPHDFGLRGHAVGFVDDDDFPAAAGHRAEVHAPQQVFDGAAVLRAAGDLDHAAPVRVAAQLVGQRPGRGRLATPLGSLPRRLFRSHQPPNGDGLGPIPDRWPC